jgi:hypothetical protein
VDLSYAPPGARAVNEGVLGEVLIKTFLGDGAPEEAAAGWGGDHYRAWDVSGKTFLMWRSVWDGPGDAREFLAAAEARLASGHPRRGRGTASASSRRHPGAMRSRSARGAWISSPRTTGRPSRPR